MPSSSSSPSSYTITAAFFFAFAGAFYSAASLNFNIFYGLISKKVRMADTRQRRVNFEQQVPEVQDERNSMVKKVAQLPWNSFAYLLLAGVVTYYMQPHMAVLNGRVNRTAFVIGCLLSLVYILIFTHLQRFVNQNGNVRMTYKDMQVHRRGYVEIATTAMLSSWVAYVWAFTPHYGFMVTVAVLTAELFGFVALMSLVL